ncbi:phospholipase D family protein [Desulfococcus multivorans]|uniref:Phospholipase D-like domain containing protein n=1 Tax=Desulfococcus multivorans DSM 2059 TaxID=1121405 RepID=S7UFF9_DESML|nr:phospholipase D family protein [Desulfococcus multivorans]AOY57233.1 putative phospholipase D/transphosphatidylase [Desulfococcus multivorans]AQV02834.2 phospholipase D family protein [Desulfococcus multivorans]EPR32544.1 Phospholipase D-like domain containing protein [Desulfococcus multivorans DSM 2059]SKA25941.1 Phosphatidylserine/phosphatidylglycerophosphate/cardiolipin synthase [Desulfococcus multivorans DSM 2059]
MRQRRFFLRGLFRTLLWAMTVILSGWAALLLFHPPLPSLEGRSFTTAFSDTSHTRIGRTLASLAAAHPDRSGVVPVADGRDAFAVRKLLVDSAEISIDVQVYIWHGDLSGTLLLNSLYRAALRGVRVRMLLDDNGTDLDTFLSALDRHPLIEVRLFNPFVQRRWPWLNYLTDFRRVNRRMHNKALVVDNQVAIVGGRNVGDEYFDADQSFFFIDLDVLAVGDVVPRISDNFDRYWASGSAYPIDRLVSAPPEEALQRLSRRTQAIMQAPEARVYRKAVSENTLVQDLKNGRLSFEWVPVHLISDDPAKGLGAVEPADHIGTNMLKRIGTAKQEIELVSPYFVPTRIGTSALGGAARKGLRVHVLTNSLSATDVPAVHAGYGKHRQKLLQQGVSLYEMKKSAGVIRSALEDRGPLGSSAASLHAKTLSLDGERIFVGSFNFDPRSALLNTEMGFVIESPRLAGAISDRFTKKINPFAYQVRLDRDGNLQWEEERGGDKILHTTEPETSWRLRALVTVLSWLPIEPLL